MQIQNDHARLRVVAARTQPIHELDGLLAVAQHIENILLHVLVQSMTQQKHIGRIVFHNYNIRGTWVFLVQLISSLRKNTPERPHF